MIPTNHEKEVGPCPAISVALLVRWLVRAVKRAIRHHAVDNLKVLSPFS